MVLFLILVSVNKNYLFGGESFNFVGVLRIVTNCFLLQNFHLNAVFAGNIHHDSKAAFFLCLKDHHHEVVFLQAFSFRKAFPPNFWNDPSKIELSKSSRNTWKFESVSDKVWSNFPPENPGHMRVFAEM